MGPSRGSRGRPGYVRIVEEDFGQFENQFEEHFDAIPPTEEYYPDPPYYGDYLDHHHDIQHTYQPSEEQSLPTTTDQAFHQPDQPQQPQQETQQQAADPTDVVDESFYKAVRTIRLEPF